MPEVPKKPVPEEKVPVAVPKKPEPPPAKGMSQSEKQLAQTYAELLPSKPVDFNEFRLE